MTKLEELRHCRGWSVLELARRSGVSPQTVARVCAGATPMLDTALRLAAACDVTIEDLWPDLVRRSHDIVAAARRYLETVNA